MGPVPSYPGIIDLLSECCLYHHLLLLREKPTFLPEPVVWPVPRLKRENNPLKNPWFPPESRLRPYPDGLCIDRAPRCLSGSATSPPPSRGRPLSCGSCSIISRHQNHLLWCSKSATPKPAASSSGRHFKMTALNPEGLAHKPGRRPQYALLLPESFQRSDGTRSSF